MKKLRLGDLLQQHQVISAEQLSKSLSEQQASGRRLGNILIERGLIDETRLLKFIAAQLHIKFWELNNYRFNAEVIKHIPETVARRYHAIPLEKHDNYYLVAMADPTDLAGIDELSRQLKLSIKIVVAREADILRIIDEVFRRTDEIISLAGELEEKIGTLKIYEDLEDTEKEAPILKLLYSIFEDAIQVNASDIHIEPDQEKIRIRLRVDGILHEQVIEGQSILAALGLRIKLMAQLNISERRLPQDGRFSIKVKEKNIDVRVATMPVQGGEALVMRLLDQSQRVLKLEQLGVPVNLLPVLRSQLRKPHGMILVTGPTGSGKTTTLYAGLSELNVASKKIVTIEDPVEYKFNRVNQVQVQSNIDLSFSKILRSVLRHDPDIIMVGEIRDEETATIALRAALTGHLVLTTLHTNNAISSPARLLEMGVAPYLVASALSLVVAQRLVKRVCRSCQQVYRPTTSDLIILDKLMGTSANGIHFLQGKGCEQCYMTGYRGRIGVYEILEMNEPMTQGLRNQDTNLFVQSAKQNKLYRSLAHWALDYACEGITSLAEVFRLIHQVEDET
jgi:MSHA biogenesis protein MshE